MALFFRLGLAGLLLLLTVLPASAETLYNQPPFSEKELNQFIADLPRFRAWIKTNKEKAHPIVNEAGEPDFLYSKNAVIVVCLIPITFDTVVFSITTQSILVPFTSRVSSATAFTPVTSVLVLMPAKFKVMV